MWLATAAWSAAPSCAPLEQRGQANFVTRTHAELDLTNQAAVQAFFASEKPTQVYLAAAKVGGIHANNTYLAEFIYQNLMIQANVIDAAFRNGVQKLLLLGSSCIYPKLAPQPMAEDALLTGPLDYRIKDPETAEWLAAATGTILVDDEVRKIERNLALSETVSAERTVRMAERFLIDRNMLMNLPAGCGVLSGASALPSFCYTSPVRADKQPQAVAVAAVGSFTKRAVPSAQLSNAAFVPSVALPDEMAAPVREVCAAKPRRVLVDEDDFL
jgi:hypothetical protein